MQMIFSGANLKFRAERPHPVLNCVRCLAVDCGTPGMPASKYRLHASHQILSSFDLLSCCTCNFIEHYHILYISVQNLGFVFLVITARTFCQSQVVCFLREKLDQKVSCNPPNSLFVLCPNTLSHSIHSDWGVFCPPADNGKDSGTG